MRMIVHAGFHKSGTTSVQMMLRNNRALVESEFRLFMRGRIRAVCESARAWSIRREPLEMSLYQFELADWMTGLDRDDPRPILISAEDLTGHMPGRHRLTRYDAAPALLAAWADIAQEVFPGITLDFCLSTRDAGPWMRSAHAQNIRATRSVETADEFAARMAATTDLIADAGAVRDAMPDGASLHHWRLEDHSGGRLGPLAPLLDLAGASSELCARIQPEPPSNKSLPPHKLEELRQLNGRDISRLELHELKRAVMLRQDG